MPNGDGGFDFGNAIPSIGDPQTNAILTIIVAILNAIIAVLNFIIAVIGAIVHFLVKASLLFVRGVKHVISDIVHGRFLHLYQDYLRLKAAIRKWIDDHLGWLLRLRAAFDRWFKNTIVPILNLIQRLRAVLAVFRIFHLKFADKLDRLLGRLESKIIRNTLKLRAKLNEIVTIIDLVLDPGLLINNNVLLASAARSRTSPGSRKGGSDEQRREPANPTTGTIDARRCRRAGHRTAPCGGTEKGRLVRAVLGNDVGQRRKRTPGRHRPAGVRGR